MSLVVRYLVVALLAGLAFASRAQGMTVDGRLDELEWQTAESFAEFRVMEPLTGAVPEHRSTMRVLARPEGLYLAMETSVPRELRVRGRSPRDAKPLPADPFVFIVDFEGEGRSAYEFTVTISGSVRDGVVLNQTQISYDWDAFWLHGVHETDAGWSAEVMIPWWVAPSGQAGEGPRTIGVYGAVYMKARSRRFAFPAIEALNPTFVQGFQRVTVPRYSGQALDFYPYAAADRDLLGSRTRARAGIDVFWKPNGSNQLTATLNPDFGQVESDDLVVNFSATETFFGDKRPFFTEGQQFFDLGFGKAGRLVNTRRIGAAPDAGEAGTSDVRAAAKYTGQSGALEYGLFAALEDDTVESLGREFLATRLRRSTDEFALGWLGTWVDRPTLGRDAQVNAIDLDWYPRDAVALQARAIRSELEGRGIDAVGYGATVALRYQPGGSFSQKVEMTWLDDDFNVNDLGYQERANVREITAETTLFRRSYPDGHWLSASQWVFEGEAFRNQTGERLPGRFEVRRGLSLRNGDFLTFSAWREFSGIDDRITRGNGDLQLDSGGGASVHWKPAESGPWRFDVEGNIRQESLGGSAWNLSVAPKWVPTDALNLAFKVEVDDNDGWLIWTGGSEVGTFRRREYSAALEGNWFPASRHELRLKFQWVGLDAEGRNAYSVAGGAQPQRLAVPPADFSLAQFGLQLRYRYEIAPLSDLYLVYGRGGEFFEQGSRRRGAGGLWSDALDRTTADQVFLKLRYRF
ncbi:MAG: hypothetical protein FGM43_08710 [Sinobacteraceae bacterium]|nr:hypothetical protein [Nevskiaceae bacterium]